MQPDDIHVYYNRGREQARLTNANGKLEQARTQEIILRYLPTPPATVMDTGGGAGIYALWLAQMGCNSSAPSKATPPCSAQPAI